MQAPSLPNRTKGSRSTFEFVDGRPLTIEQKSKFISKVRSNARRWQLEQQKVAINGTYNAQRDAKEDSLECQPGHEKALHQYLWTSGIFAGGSPTGIVGEYSSKSSGSPGISNSQTSWDDSHSAQTSLESFSDCDSSPWETSSISDANFAVSVIRDKQNWMRTSGASDNQDPWSGSNSKFNPFGEPGGLDEGISRNEMIPAGLFGFLGAGMVDPFETYPSKLPGFLIAKYISSIFAREPLRSATAGRPGFPTTSHFIRNAISTPLGFHTLMFASASADLTARGLSIEDSPQDLSYSEGEAVKLLNERISDPRTACSVETIYSVLFLANIGLDPAAKWGHFRAPQQGPLQGLLCLDVYGKYGMRREHRQGLLTLLKMRGGLDTFGPYHAFPALISYVDTVEAVRSMTRPNLPYCSITKGVGERNLDFPAAWFGRPNCELQNLGQGLDHLRPSLGCAASTLLEVFEDMQHYTIVLDKHKERIEEYDLPLMADHRNSIQHRLLSLSVDFDTHGYAIDNLYPSLWLAANVYCLIVVFPYPISTAPFDLLARRLRSAMSIDAMLWKDRPELTLWLAFMGGLAALDTASDRHWFAQAVWLCSSCLQLATWTEAKRTLGRFLWCGFVSDDDGWTLFEEAQRHAELN